MAIATVTGNAASEPKFGLTKSGKGWCSFSLAENRGSGENKKTTWFKVKVFSGDFAENFAENVSSSIKKGTRVTVVGRIETDEWTGQDGSAKTDLVLVADDVAIKLRYAEVSEVTRNAREGEGGNFGNRSSNGGGYANNGASTGGGYASEPVVAGASEDPFF